MSTIVENIRKTQGSTPEIVKFYEDNIALKKVSKGKILQRAGDKSVKAFYVKKGLLRSYVVDGKGKEHIYLFAPEGWLVTDVELMSSQNGATLIIEALEESEVEVLSERVFRELDKLPVPLLKSEVLILINRINALQRRVLQLMLESAEERYHAFLKTYPDIVQRVPQKMIASYLGITPQALSSIRSKGQ
jgi:CRP-like cAMP-binding protein